MRKFTYKHYCNVVLKANFSIFCMIFVVSSTFCQKTVIPTGRESQAITLKNPVTTLVQTPARTIHSGGDIHPDRYNSSFTIQFSPPITPDFYSRQLGFFCKKEIKFEKSTHVPFKFRLGSLQQCDWLEGKRY